MIIFRGGPAAVLLAGFLALPAAHAQTCAADMKDARRAESGAYAVAYRLAPPNPGVSRHFSVEVAVCAKGGAPEPGGLRIEARMPAHGHGMNYAAKIRPLGDGRFHAEGLMFHMPGRWEFVFEFVAGQATQRVTHAINFK